jgi:hypothetical protein
MGDPSMARFLAYLNGHPDLRAQVERLELSLTAALAQEAQDIAAIAADAGFDVSGWNARPSTAEPTEKNLSCCGFMTWGTWWIEETLQ